MDKWIRTICLLFLYVVTLFIFSTFRSALAYRSVSMLIFALKATNLQFWLHGVFKKEKNIKHKSSIQQNIFLCKIFLIAVQTVQNETLKSRFAKGRRFVFHFHFYSQTHSTSEWKEKRVVFEWEGNWCYDRKLMFSQANYV